MTMLQLTLLLTLLISAGIMVALALFGLAVPWLANLFYVSGLYPFPGLEPVPLAFAVTGLAF